MCSARASRGSEPTVMWEVLKCDFERGKFEHTEGRVVGPAYVALWGAGKVSR